jgi:hypothetical protein
MEKQLMRLAAYVPRIIKQSLLSAFLLVCAIVAVAATGQSVSRQQGQIQSLSAAEFSRLSRELSEEGGYFRSDNFTSNETSYLHVVDKLRQLGATSGAYIGVGPEQNFTYIAKIRPRIAFIIDIRRQAMIQHLMAKAVFHLSPTRAEFLSKLLSRPVPKEKLAALNASVPEMIAFFRSASMDEKTYGANLSEIRRTIQNDFQFPLSESDQSSLDYVYQSFCSQGLGIPLRGGGRGGNSPDLGILIAETDLHGKMGNFLATADDYEFVRELHRKHLIIPVVGDFGGKKALVGVGDYLRKNGYTVTAFYTSNVEQYLFDSGSFAAFAANVRKLPITDKSLFIRSASSRYGHPSQVAGHRWATLLQQVTVFLKDFDGGVYTSYPTLLTTNFIAAEKLSPIR